MLTAAVVSYDPIGRAALAKCLQETGLVRQVLECSDTSDSQPALVNALPEVVLLDLAPDDPSPQFDVASFLHRLSPSIRIVAVSALEQPDAQLLMRAMRFGVREFLHKPAQVSLLREVLVRFEQERGTVSATGPRKLIAVMGAKGGVGATTIAVNLSVQLAQISRKRVTLLDFSRPLGFVDMMLDIHPKFSLRDAAQNASRMDTHFFDGLLTQHKSGLAVLGGVSDPNEWANIAMSSIPRIAEIAQNHSDYVVMDLGVSCPPEWSEMLSGARYVLMVSEAHVTSLWAVERQVSALMARHVDASLLRLVINRWHRRDDAILKSIEQRTKRNIFMRLPNNFTKVNDAVNTGTPLADNHDNAIVSRLRDFATEITGATVQPRRTGLGNLFSSNSSR